MLATLIQDATDPIAAIELDAFLVHVVVAALIPIATGIITKVTASPAVKQIVTLALSYANALVMENVQADGSAIISKEIALYTLVSFAIAVGTYLGVYQSHDTNAKLLPTKGIG